MEKDGILYTIGQPIQEASIIRHSDGDIVNIGGTINPRATTGVDCDCKIIGSGPSSESVQDTPLILTWSDNTGRDPEVAFPGGYSGVGLTQPHWKVPDTPGFYTITCTWTNDSSNCFYPDNPLSDSVTLHAIDICALSGSYSFVTATPIEIVFDGGSFTDDCGNTVSTAHNSSNGCWETFYNGKIVGRCIWLGGKNLIQIEYTSESLYGKKRIVKVRHSSKNDDDPWLQRYWYYDEGCDGYYCYLAHQYDAISQSWDFRNYRGKTTIPATSGNMGPMWPGEAEDCQQEDEEHHGEGSSRGNLEIPE